MFNGVPAEQYHQFIASRTSLPIPLSFPFHNHISSPTFPTFDPYPSHHQTLQIPHFLHHHQSPTNNNDEEKEQNSMLISTNLELQRERTVSETIDPWSNDELLALLKIRSSLENWFSDLTWEHVSRKLAELGFKRSAEKCKEKFEEETRNFNTISYNKNNRLFFSELEEFYHAENPQVSADQKNQTTNQKHNEEEEEEDKMGLSLEEDSRNLTLLPNPSHHESEEVVVKKSTKNKRRKRKQKFEMFKGFCEDIVNKMMAQQEELHNKLLEDMVNREEQKIAREEAWKKQEMERINKEIEMRAHEQTIAAGDRQASIIEFLKKYTSNSSQNQCFGMIPNSSTSPTSPPQILPQTHNSTCQLSTQSNEEAVTASSTMVNLAHQNSSSLTSQYNPTLPTSLPETQPPSNPSSSLSIEISTQPTYSTLALPYQKNPNSEREDIGKRWPKDEVLALINMRCSLYSSNEEKEGGTKGPLWERISQGMLEFGYKRSSKRCKEKWENINKYFRKTKDVNKKRSLDSRTCPYFHQLSSLYKQGILTVAHSDGSGNRPTSPENHSDVPETTLGATQGGSSDANMYACC